jgi:hypothetical protein
MKKALIISGVIFFLASCSNGSTTDRGVQDDGIKVVDSNGGLPDTAKQPYNPKTDTAMGEDRVDIQKRDSSKVKK